MTGIQPARLDLLLRRVRLEVDEGTLPSAQVAVASDGELVASETFGRSTPSTRYILQSVGRTIVAAAVWKLIGEGLLDVDERVAEIVPEFATNGKDIVTVEQVLTHTAGFPFAPLGYPKMKDRASRLEAFAKWRLTYEPGTQLQWHLTSAAWVIAEVIERRTGLPFADYLRREIVEPLGLSIELGVPVARQAGTVAMPEATDRERDDQEVDPWGPWYLADPEVLAAGEPSHSTVATAADVALFFQALFHSGLWSPEAVAEGTRSRVRMVPEGEEIYGGRATPAEVGLFVTVAGDDGSATFLPSVGSPATFGHGGAPCQVSFMDPEVGVSFAFLTNGYPLSGYDYSRSGRARIANIANLAADLMS